jgi:hypothetical protein
MKRLTVLAILALFGCELLVPAPPMVGTWEWQYNGVAALTITFNADLTCTSQMNGQAAVNGTYTYDATTLTLTWEGNPAEVVNYSIAGDALTISQPGQSISVVLTRKK